MIVIDGSEGEGGGQVLRSALALAILTGQPVRIENVRAGRKKPGLLRQHLTALEAAGRISAARLEGAQLGSRCVELHPQAILPGEYRFAVGSAGSANLVLQTLLYPLLFADGPSRLVLEGGTHNDKSPPFHFLKQVLLPLLGRMGAELHMELERWGFFPAGGGRMVVDVAPVRRLEPLALLERGELRRRQATAVLSEVPGHVADRELSTVRSRLGWRAQECRSLRPREVGGPGNVLMLELEHAEVSELVIGFGARGVRAEEVAIEACDAVRRWQDAEVPVGEHLADQLLIPLALAGGGAFRSVRPSLHTTTNRDVIERFLDARFTLRETGEDRSEIQVSGPSFTR
jgi:RNA 3'-terminal phosphate cyclase (ATP)